MTGASNVWRPRTASQAVFALTCLAAGMAAGRRPFLAFADVYAAITRRVFAEVSKGTSVFACPGWMSRLAGRFCEMYLDTVRRNMVGERQPAGAWALYYRREVPVPPTIDAALGLNAHINYDLPVGLFESLAESVREAADSGDTMALMGWIKRGGGAPSTLTLHKGDHDEVNALLAQTAEVALTILAGEHGCRLATALLRWRRPVLWLVMAVIRRWRETAWREAVRLLEARDDAERAAVRQRLDRRSTRYARWLLRAARVWERLSARAPAGRPA